MLASVRSISSLVSSEIDAGIPANRIVVGGFSQGAVISYLTALTSERKLAGVVALSGFLGMADKIKSVSLMGAFCRRFMLLHSLDGEWTASRGSSAHSRMLASAQMLSDHATSLPIFHGHGDADPVVQYKWGQDTVSKLKELGFKDVEFNTYPRAFPARRFAQD